MSEAIRDVIVAGSGSIAWISACGLARAFRGRLGVTVVDTGPDGSAVGYWTLPSQRGIHALLGINESHFIAQTGSTFRLASEHRDWQGAGTSFLHAHGEIGTDLEGTPFHAYLQAEQSEGRAVQVEAFSVAGAAARLAKFARPMGTDLTASFTYGYHVEEARYADYLRAHAQRLGVRLASAPLSDVMCGDGEILALTLADGARVTADLYVDCSGPAARLIERIAPGTRDDWSAWLPCDRMLSGLTEARDDSAAVTRTRAGAAGWSWRAPLASKSMAGLVHDSRRLDEAAALDALRSATPDLLADTVQVASIRAGRREEPWRGNCVALGPAALELEPLVGATHHYAQLGLATLIELFPLRRSSKVEAREFNRVIAGHADGLRDFTLAHYHAGPARDDEFWRAVRAAQLPAPLAQRLEHYAASGRLTLRDHETFEETDWAWLLIGAGCVPGALEVQTRDRLAKLARRDVDTLRERVRQIADSMPPHAEFVRRQASPGPAR